MASSTILQVGDTVPIVLFLESRDISLHPQAVVCDKDNGHIITIDLEYKADGALYAPAVLDQYPMPNENFISVTYNVYTNPGHSVLSAADPGDIDTFALGSVSTAAILNETLSGYTIPDSVGAALSFLYAIQGGDWNITDEGGGTMIYYEEDHTTEIARFSLFNKRGNRASVKVFRRERQ